ncbi:HIT domain-containing protein [Aeromicrobium sp. IC_218]|uniref:HIT family protein n=1 Tax=Aeromicrobium sp. IC_218 TaxID=2545468 RepID=UPI00103FC238|nr:HIT domain-containing protein [Aeromicrobium sp. IC_218]TCI99845.1 HIT domain-containing protein [Aeromicrobium sp. IC_218]
MGDELERLWVPYRLAYVRGEAGDPADDRCPFCVMVDEPAEDDLVVHRGSEAFVALNLYPYNPGHLMVLPRRHVADYADLTPSETVEVAELTQHALRTIRQVSQPHGFNVGINLGGVAGGSLSAHLHQHVVPRWGGDANFMTVVGKAKTMNQVLEDTCAMLREAWTEED